MIKIGITGSIASGKSLVAHFLSKRKKFLFSADEEVKTLYKQKDAIETMILVLIKNLRIVFIF